MTGVIWTTRGEPILVSEEDLPRVSNHTWHIDKQGYARAGISGKVVKMHRFLRPEWSEIDHANGDKADNRRENLRLATRAQNRANVPKWAGCSSEHKGVSWHKRRGMWQARITINKRLTALGYYKSELEAAAAYRTAASEAFGEFANFGISS